MGWSIITWRILGKWKRQRNWAKRSEAGVFIYLHTQVQVAYGHLDLSMPVESAVKSWPRDPNHRTSSQFTGWPITKLLLRSKPIRNPKSTRCIRVVKVRSSPNITRPLGPTWWPHFALEQSKSAVLTALLVVKILVEATSWTKYSQLTANYTWDYCTLQGFYYFLVLLLFTLILGYLTSTFV